MSEHLLVLAVSGDRVHGVPVKVPVLFEDIVTVPVGLDFVPVSVSVTVAVHVVGCPTATVAGVQLTPVEVERLFTVTMAVPLDAACVLSPP